MSPAPTLTPRLTIRRARPGDEPGLAALEPARPLRGERLIAERGGRVIAAISLVDGEAAVDHDVAYADALTLLRLRYAQSRMTVRPRLRLPRLRRPARPALAYA